MPEEGKTFIATNLASVYSLLGKKTVLVGFDLRKPRIFQEFNLTNDKGVSTWLIGKDNLEDIMQKNPITVDVNAPLSDVLDIMLENGILRIPVTDGLCLVGIISRSAILRTELSNT